MVVTPLINAGLHRTFSRVMFESSGNNSIVSRPRTQWSMVKHNMQSYSGVNTSLYHTLSEGSMQSLEKASILTDRGFYKESQRIYDNELLAQRLLPVVVLGRAELALKQYKMGLLYRMLDEALSIEGADLDAAEYRVMAVMWAFAAYSHKGACDPAVVEIERAQEWLKDVPVTVYTDVQVCARNFP